MHQSLLLGSHMSIGGGIHTAFQRGTQIGCATMQVFTKNANRWDTPPIPDVEVQLYKSAETKADIAPVVAHAAYLINLCAANRLVLDKSRKALQEELFRCEQLGIRGLILHPGSHVGAGEEDGMRAIAESINIAHEKTSGFRTLTVLETTAGQGSTIGYRFEQLRGIIDLVQEKQRIGICLDTCHVFAAGYQIGTEDGWNSTITEFDSVLGLQRLIAVHVNDSRKELGSRIDRHEHIGKGRIGIVGFRNLMNDPRFLHIPKILETEKSEDMHEDVENMSVLASLVVDRQPVRE